MNVNFDINILLCIQYTYVYVIYIWLWLIISTVYTYAGQSVSCIQAAQDHSMPLKSKGRRQHRNQPRVDATEHTPRLLGLKPRNHKRQDIVVNSDVSENYFVFFFKRPREKEWEEALVCSETTCFWKQGVKQRLLQLMNKHPVKCHQLKNIYTYMYMICIYHYIPISDLS